MTSIINRLAFVIAGCCLAAAPSSAQCPDWFSLPLDPADASVSDRFGDAVDVQGADAVVGATSDFTMPSAAYVFVRAQSGPYAWDRTIKLEPVQDDNESFGESVSIDGDTILVSSAREQHPGGTGVIHVFERNEGGPEAWGRTGRVRRSVNGAFGLTVELSGDTALIGTGIVHSGLHPSSYAIIERDLGSNPWGLRTTLGFPINLYGPAAIDGDTIVVGSPGEDQLPSLFTAGAIYIYERDQGGADSWGEVIRIPRPVTATVSTWGWSVAIDGDLAAAGGPYDELFIFERNQGGPDAWGVVKQILAPCVRLSISGERIIAGFGNDAFPALIFGRDEGGPNHWGQIDAFEGGVSVALDGSVAVVGTNLFEQGAPHDGGYVTSYCPALPNSADIEGARLDYSGTLGAAANDLVLQAAGAVPGQLGLFIMGTGRASIAVGEGTLCTSPFFRIYPATTIQAGGTVVYPLDFNALPPAAGSIAACQTWDFQLWFRDPSGGPAGYNFSDALEITFGD